jgi:hypothetical protein
VLPLSFTARAQMRHRFVLTLGALIATTLLQWYLNMPAPWPIPQWTSQLGPLIGGLKEVIPGALIGFVAGRHGLLFGAIVGFIGRLAVTVPVYLKDQAGSSTSLILLHTAIAALGFAVVAAAAGGAGQLLRSNNRWRGP